MTIHFFNSKFGISRYFSELVNNLDDNYKAKLFCPVHCIKMIMQNKKILK